MWTYCISQTSAEKPLKNGGVERLIKDVKCADTLG